MEKKGEEIAEWLGEKGTYLYVLAMLVIFPLFYTNGVWNLQQDKANFFLYATSIYMCVLFPVFIKWVCDCKKGRGRCIRAEFVFAAILLLALAVSTAIAPDSQKSFFGSVDRMIGGICVLGCVFVFLAVRQFGIFDGLVLWGWLLGSSLIYLLGILCVCGIDVLHLQDGMLEAEKPIYPTPMSHMDYNTCYICLMLPPIIVMYMICKEKFSQILHGINLYLGFLFVYFVKTDSVLIAMAAGLLALLYFAVEKEVWFKRYLQVMGIYLGAKITIWLLLYSYGEYIYPFNDLGEKLLTDSLIFGEVGFYLLITGIYIAKKEWLREKLFAVRKVALWTGVGLAVCFLIGVLYANFQSENIHEGSLWSYLVIGDSTFNERGLIWKRTVHILINEPVERKLFGNGLNCFSEFLIEGGMNSPDIMSFHDPHNEFLQMLSDMGIVGVIGYFGLLLSTLIRALKNWKKNELQIVVVLTLCVYLIQGLVNEYSIFYLPLLCIFLGLANGSMTKNQNNEVENS